MQTNETPNGEHILADFHGVAAQYLSDPDYLQSLFLQAAEKAQASVIDVKIHHFGEKMGVTGVVLLAESHLSFHSWPEVEWIAIDIFMCGNSAPDRALRFLQESLKPKTETIQYIKRSALVN